MTTLIVDTEFTWEPGMARLDEDGSERVPHPPNAIVESIAYVAIGRRDGRPTVRLGYIEAETERDRVERFVSAWTRTRPRVVTFSGRLADVPLITARCVRHGIVAPLWTQKMGFATRYDTRWHADLFELLGNFGSVRRGGLDDWARCVGWPGKGDVDGSRVAELLASPGGRERVDHYCLRDAAQTAAVFLRHTLSTGELSLDSYREHASALLQACEADARLAELAAGVDRDRWLLPVASVVAPPAQTPRTEDPMEAV